jgi:micrococcal nuclease
MVLSQDKAPELKQGFIVDEVVDGDTILIETGEYVRLIGINAPERREDLYEESKKHLESLILGKAVTLKSDVTDKDSYGRLLRFVYFNGTNINKEMIKTGYALPMHIAPDISQKVEIDAVWRECMEEKVNLCS